MFNYKIIIQLNNTILYFFEKKFGFDAGKHTAGNWHNVFRKACLALSLLQKMGWLLRSLQFR